MATLEDRLLGEKLEYYCSSSESEGEESPKVEPPPASKTYSSKKGSSNTGPKGVIEDWQRFKQLEVEKREEQQKEKEELARKFTLTCKSAKDEEEERRQEEELEAELNQLMSDPFLQEYTQKRMQEMMQKKGQLPTFGKVVNIIDGSSFLNAIDKEDKNVTVIVHIYDKMLKECERLNKCLNTLAENYPDVKFCKMLGTAAGVSERFKKFGIPTLLAYKGGSLLGTFVSLANEFGTDFVDSDVEGFLVEHGILSDKSLVPPGIAAGKEDSDSD